MLKAGTQFVVVVMGLSSLALSTGCGRDKQAFDQKLSEVKAAALDACLGQKSSKAGCESGLLVAENAGRMMLPGQLQIRTEGEERVTEVRVQSLDTYMAAVKRACYSEATPTRTDREGFAFHGPTDAAKQAGCQAGAQAFFIEFGKSCNIDIVTMGANDSAICLLKREAIQEEVQASAPVQTTRSDRMCSSTRSNLCF